MAAEFRPWSRPGAHELTKGGAALRRSGTVPLQLSDASGNPRVVPLTFSLLGVGDVAGLRAGAIRRRHPAPGVSDMASELAAHVEFAAPDLPWRYAPDEPTTVEDGSRAMRPWLVLLAGAAADIVPLGRTRVRVAPAVLQKAPLSRSHLWAHVHTDEAGGSLSRLLSPCKLEPNTFCRAALVPAYRVGAGDSVGPGWTGAEPVPIDLPLYDTWTFTTGADDDFPQLARQLHRVSASTFTGTTVHVRQRAEDVPMAGALMRPTDLAAFEAAHSPALASLVEAWPIFQAAGRWVLAPPLYDQRWSPLAGVVAAWAMELRRDVRRRGAAGLGAWCAIDQQDQLVEGVRRQAGVIDHAAHDARMLALGLAAGRSLFERRLPPASDASGRLAVLGPLLRGMGAKGGGVAADALRNHTPALHPALLSGAVRRTIRPGTALAAGARPGLTVGALLDAANQCRPPERPSPFTELAAGADPQHGTPLDSVIAHWRRSLGGFARRAASVASAVAGQSRRFAEPRPGRRCRRADFGALADALIKAIDPSSPDAPAIRRVRGRYQGIGTLLPAPVFEPELDLPLAPVLSRLAPQWMLPGRGQLEPGGIVGLASNPRFIESCLVGANLRALGELRWRNVRVASGWSPLRRFWPRPDGVDVTPIRVWSGALADVSHRPANDSASLLVFVIRSPILRRYPGTAIYLLRMNEAALVQMANSDTPPAEALREQPIFKGALEPDLYYIGFKVPPEKETDYAVVFEEPLAEPRFRLEPPAKKGTAEHASWSATLGNAWNGASYAMATFHRRTIAVITW